MMKTERQFENWLTEVIFEGNEVLNEGENVSIRTFEEAGLLTYNKGLVIRLKTGEEFQITIVKR